MKLDKETVIKHQFWFLLGTYALVWFIAVLWLKVVAVDPIEAAKKDYQTHETNLKNASTNPVNVRTFLPPWEQYTKLLEGHKRTIWTEAWNLQEGMYNWPPEFAQSRDMTTIKAEISYDERNKYIQEMYPKQIKQLQDSLEKAPRWLNPIEILGGFEKFFNKQVWSEVPTREEIWLAQEDYWVKREFLYILYRAMMDQAFMVSVPIDDKKEPMPEGVKYRFRYRNDTWELTLHIREKEKEKGILVVGGDSTIKNIHPSMRPQPLMSIKGTGIAFTVTQDAVSIPLEVKGEPVAYAQTQTLSSNKDQGRQDYPPLDGIDWTKFKDHPIFLTQGFDQTNCPIRRLNAFALGKQDIRTFTFPLYPNAALMALDAPAEDPNAKKDPSSGGGGGGSGSPEGMIAQQQNMQSMMKKVQTAAGGGGMGSGTQSAAAKNPTPNNGIERDRYLNPPSKEKDKDGKEKEPPGRHLPFALQLLVEQSHMHDVLMTLANSRLRIQITQVEFHRTRDFIPSADADKKDPTGVSNLFMPRSGSGMAGGGMGGGYGMRGGMYNSMGGGKPGSMMGGMGGGSGAGNPMMMMQQQMTRMQQGMLQGSGMMGKPTTLQMLGGGGAGNPMQGSNPKSTTTPSEPKPAPHSQPDENVVEVTIYGVATLYRKPDAPPAEPGAQQPPAGQPTEQPAATPQQPTATQPADQKQSDQKQPDAKQPDAKKEDEKKSEDKKAEDKKVDGKKPDDKQDKKSADPPAGKQPGTAPPSGKEKEKR